MVNDVPSVLVVDPYPTLFKAQMDSVSENSVEFSYARDGKHALSLLASQPYSLIVLDQDLPDMPGVELLSAIVERDPHQHCIFYTSSQIPLDDLSVQAPSVTLFPKSKHHARLWNHLMAVAPIAHSCMKLRYSNERMSMKLERLAPLERMIGRYAERWQVSYEEARQAITHFARHTQFSLHDLSMLAEERHEEVNAARQQLESIRRSIEDRLKDSEPGVLLQLEEFCMSRLKSPADLVLDPVCPLPRVLPPGA